MTLADGMTIDSEGMLWIAVAGSGEVRRYSPRGEVDTVVRVPVACPTSVAFGGEDLDDLYITTMTPHGEPGPDPRVPKPLWPPRPLEGALFVATSACRVGRHIYSPGDHASCLPIRFGRIASCQPQVPHSTR
jgi:hypothetical protein